MMIIVSLGILAHLVFLLVTTDREVLSNISKIKIPYLFVIAILSLVPWLGAAFRLRMWTRFINHPLSYKDCLKTQVYTDLGGALSPTAIGGGPVKLGYLINKGMSPGKAGLLTALNGFEDFVMYCFIIIVSFFHIRESIGKIFGAISNFVLNNYLMILGIIVGIILLRFLIKLSKFQFRNLMPRTFRVKLNRFARVLKENLSEMKTLANQVFAEGKLTFFISFIVLMLSWLARFSILLVLLWSLGIAFKPFQIYLQQWIVYITMIFVPTPGASGGAEASFYLIFGGEIPKEILPLVVSTWRFFTYYFMLFSAVMIVQFYAFRTKKAKANLST